MVIVENGQLAVEKIQQEKFDLCFMDCMMPVMDGYTAVEVIRQLPHKQIPIIALTANSMAGDKEKCLAAGMDDYLAKPIEKAKLKEKICHWLALESRKNIAEKAITQ